MECTSCGSELDHVDTYGFLCAHQSGEILGQIYKCPNYEGFQDMDQAIEYALNNDIDYVEWEDIVCCSEVHNGNFYTDKQDNLHEGYPC